MADLEDRVVALEARVDELAFEVRHATGVGVDARRTALGAHEAHQRNIELLYALRATQAEHSRILAEHSRRFDAIDQRFEAVDRRFDAIDRRLDAVDGTLGRVTVGMHAIESLLRDLVDSD